MILGFLTLLIMLIVAYAHWREGPLTSFAMCCNVLLAGLVAFNFWEPIAAALEPSFRGTFAQGTEDALVLMLLFCPTLMLLRWLTNNLASTHTDYPSWLFRGGAVVFGMLTGYLLAGFLMCVFQTLPWQRDFLSFSPYEPHKSTGVRKLLPPDMMWLAMMHRLSQGGLSPLDGEVFDKHGRYPLKYLRHRRTDEKGQTMPYRGEMPP